MAVTPVTPTTADEVRFAVTVDPPGPMPYITKIDFGDGTEVECTYYLSGARSEDCDTYVSEDGKTQYCFHTYKNPGAYMVIVAGRPGHDSPLTTGGIDLRVNAATSQSPSPILPSEQPYKRVC